MYKKTASVLAIVAMLTLPSASAAQASDITSSIASLIEQIQKLKSALTASAAGALDDDYGTGETGYCPNLTRTLQRGSTDARTGGQVTELQLFLANYYDLDENASVSGHFGAVTARNVIRFQKEMGLPALGIAGGLTRAAIARACGGLPSTTTPILSTPTYPQTAPRQSASIDASSLSVRSDKDRVLVSITGTAIGVDGVDVGLRGYIGGYSPVVNGRWTVKLQDALPTGSYVIQVTARNGSVLTNGTLSVSANTSTNVQPLQSPVITFTSSSMDIHAGESITLSWNAIYANRCVLKFGSTEIGGMPAVGSQAVSPTQTTSYLLWCVNEPGNGKDGPAASKTVNVNVRPPVPQDISFAPNTKTTFTLVNGQTATNGPGGVRIKLDYTAMDSLGYSVVGATVQSGSFQSGFYSARAGMSLMGGGGIVDALSTNQGLMIDVTAIDKEAGTAQFTVEPSPPKG